MQFETVDLYEAKDLALVVRCLFSLGSTVQTKFGSGWTGPRLGVARSKGNKRNFHPEDLRKKASELGGLPHPAPV